MQKRIKDILINGKVFRVTIQSFDSLDEAKSNLGEEVCLNHINHQHAIDTMNNKRKEEEKEWPTDPSSYAFAGLPRPLTTTDVTKLKK